MIAWCAVVQWHGDASTREDVVVLAPTRAAARRKVQAELDANYQPGAVVLQLEPEQGFAVWGAR